MGCTSGTCDTSCQKGGWAEVQYPLISPDAAGQDLVFMAGASLIIKNPFGDLLGDYSMAKPATLKGESTDD